MISRWIPLNPYASTTPYRPSRLKQVASASRHLINYYFMGRQFKKAWKESFKCLRYAQKWLRREERIELYKRPMEIILDICVLTRSFEVGRELVRMLDTSLSHEIISVNNLIMWKAAGNYIFLELMARNGEMEISSILKQEFREQRTLYKGYAMADLFEKYPIENGLRILKNVWNLKECQFCQRKNKVLRMCKSCRAIFYCSKKCQKRDWKDHKKQCC